MSFRTLLIVDDEPANLALLAQVLQPFYRVRAANSGTRALRAAASSPRPDLILLDVMMPGMDGYAVLASLRENPDTADIPVMFVTALDDEVNEERGFQLGAVDYIIKPIKPVVTLARVAAQLELKEARDRLADQNAWLEAEVARRMEEILTIQDVGLYALAQLAETRDHETGLHIRRTQEYVGLLARLLRRHPRFEDALDEHFIQLLTKSAPLHDIGKVGIPDAILRKPGKLTPEERSIMQDHARLGAEAISKAVRDSGKPTDFLRLAMEIAHWHHERWDGSGYPDGLVGEAIPVSARVMAIADVFDALVSKRVYKASRSIQEAREVIAAGRGSQFDPDCTDAFLGSFAEFAAIAEHFRDHD